jgi:hypothetical protein
MCRVLKVHRSGYYAWLKEPQSLRALENAKLSTQIRYYYDQSMGIYGSPRIHHNLREAGISCSENRVARLMKASQLRSIRGYKRPRYQLGRPALVPPNQLQRQFNYDAPDQAWVTDITYVRTHEGWLSPSMSRRGNCWDNAVAESFFSSLKSELIKKRIYPTRAQAKSEIFEYIEEFYDRRKSPWDNRVRRHKHLSQLSPLAFEQRQIALRKMSTILGECQRLIKKFKAKFSLYLFKEKINKQDGSLITIIDFKNSINTLEWAMYYRNRLTVFKLLYSRDHI